MYSKRLYGKSARRVIVADAEIAHALDSHRASQWLALSRSLRYRESQLFLGARRKGSASASVSISAEVVWFGKAKLYPLQLSRHIQKQAAILAIGPLLAGYCRGWVAHWRRLGQKVGAGETALPL